MRIKQGAEAIDFTVKDVFGKSISLKEYRGKKLLLSFYRYASCPPCNLRVHRLIERFPYYREKGLNILSFFESPAENIRRYVGKQDAPFPIIPDPGRKIFKLYGIEKSWAAVIPGFMQFGILYHAILKNGYFTNIRDTMSGKLNSVPADFLIDPQLKIYKSYYGKHIADHLPYEEIDAFAEE